jgi:hypothetical protein
MGSRIIMPKEYRTATPTDVSAPSSQKQWWYVITPAGTPAYTYETLFYSAKQNFGGGAPKKVEDPTMLQALDCLLGTPGKTNEVSVEIVEKDIPEDPERGGPSSGSMVGSARIRFKFR